jgi:hypothetical protein
MPVALPSNLTSHWVYGVPWGPILALHNILAGSDVAAAGLSLAQNVGLTGVLTLFALPFTSRTAAAGPSFKSLVLPTPACLRFAGVSALLAS